MTDITPRPRIRPAVTATTLPVAAVQGRVRVRNLPVDPAVTVTVQPRTRTRPVIEPSSTVNPWYVPSGARPLGSMQRTHNGFTPTTGELPDPRFRPLLIVMNPAWRQHCPGWVSLRFEEALAWTPEDCALLPLATAGNAYITEWGLRHSLGYRALKQDVYEALHARLLSGWENRDPKTCIPSPQRQMMTLDTDKEILVDLTKSSGPFYCDSLLAIEHHYAKRLQPVAR